MYKDIMRLAALVSIASVVTALAVTALGSCQLGTRAVGVKAGDWVKYSVTRLGSSNLAWIHPDVVWIKVEVLTASDMTVTVRETIHNADGTENVKNSSLNLENGRECYSYIIPADLKQGWRIRNLEEWDKRICAR
jgi:hypothetical protein